MKKYIYSRIRMILIGSTTLLIYSFFLFYLTRQFGYYNIWFSLVFLFLIFIINIYNEWNSVVQLDSRKIVRISRDKSIKIMIKDIVELKKYKFLNWYLIIDKNDNKMFIDSTFNNFSDLIGKLQTYMDDNKNM